MLKDKRKPALLMDATSEEIRTALKRRHLVDKTHHYILVNPSLLSFASPNDALLPHIISNTPGVRKAEGILLYDDEHKQCLGYFPGDPDQDTQTKLPQCQRTTLRHHRPGPYGSRTSRRLIWHLHRLRRFEAGISRFFYKTQKMPRSGLPKRGRLLCVATCLPGAGVVGDTKSSGDGSCRCRDETSDLRVDEADEAQADHTHGHMIPVVEQDVPWA